RRPSDRLPNGGVAPASLRPNGSLPAHCEEAISPRHLTVLDQRPWPIGRRAVYAWHVGVIASDVGVPFLDLGPSHALVKDDILSDVGSLIDTNAFINGPHVAAFESAWAARCGTARCVGVASGLDALRLGLIAAGIQRGDEVVVPANTFAATFEAVTQAGGRPVPADVSPADYN